ncbi:hypothetical protein NKJ35_27260 [Mesorhizobium sp. M0136]|uniref:GDSL-type esterase/lipase family protein n=1 Tax=Mesorhizobium sp. M0136 TaxID=2956890 RepID=UPI00333B9160
MAHNAILSIPNVTIVPGPAGQSFLPVDDASELTADFGRDRDRAIVRANGDEWLKTAGVWAATGENFWGTLLAQGATQVDQARLAAEQAQTIADAFGDLEAGVTLAQAAAAAAAQDAVQTAADRTATGIDRAATGADAGQTAADRIATAADRAQTGLDRAATGVDAGQTAADRIATGADRTQTGLDVVQTGQDRVATDLDRAAAASSASTAASDAALTANNVAASSTYAAAAADQGGFYANTAATNVPRGVSKTVGAITPGSGGPANGTYSLAWTGGNFAINPTGEFDIVSGSVAAVRITGRGRYIGASPVLPTPSFASAAGLTGAAVVLNPEFLVVSGQSYYALSADGTYYQLYLNNSGAPAIVVGSISRILSPATQGDISNGIGGTGYVEQGKVKPAVQQQFNNAGALTRLPQQPAIQPIIAGRNGGVFLGLRLSDGKAILPLASESVQIDPENVSLVQAIDHNVSIPGRGMRNYIGLDARKPIVAGKNGGVLMWLDTSVSPPALSGNFIFSGVQYQALFPNDARGLVSDYASIAEQSVDTLRFLRPVNDSNNFQHCAPGARVGYITTAQYMQLDVYWNNLVTRLDTYNTLCAVLVDGALFATFSSGFAPGTPGDQSYTFDFGSVGKRLVEVVWCLAAGMELRQTRFSANAALALGSARPNKLLNTHGDSTTHGLGVSSIYEAWAFGLAVDLGRQLLNTGNGSNTAVASQGAVVGQAILDKGIADAKSFYSIGINDCITNRVPTVAFKTAVEGYLAGFRTKCPTTPLVFCGAFYCPAHETAHTYPLQDYRDVMQAIVVAAADPNLTYVDGKALMVNSSDRLGSDQTHPNNLGASEIRTNLFTHF